MIQRSTYTSRRKNPPQKFIPRRDLFPDAELPPPAKTTAKAADTGPYWQQDGSTQYRNKQALPQTQGKTGIQPVSSGRTYPKRNQPLPLQQPLKPVKKQGSLPFHPAYLVFLLAGGFLLWPILKESQPKLASRIESAMKSIVDNPQSIQLLRTIGPYLEDPEQDAAYTVAGVLEAVSTIRGVMNHTYHERYRSSVLHVPKNPTAKRLELMKAIKPYFPESSRKQLEQVIGTYNTIEQLNRNIEIYRNNRILAGNRKPTSLEALVDLFNVLRPALPQEYREKGDKAVQVLKMMEVAGAAEKMSRSSKKERSAQKEKPYQRQDKADAMSLDETGGDSGSADPSSGKTDQMQKLMDSFAPMLNDEQKESLSVIMKMAQLLSQPGDDSQGSDEEES